jgi:hypothetical protein
MIDLMRADYAIPEGVRGRVALIDSAIRASEREELDFGTTLLLAGLERQPHRIHSSSQPSRANALVAVGPRTR